MPVGTVDGSIRDSLRAGSRVRPGMSAIAVSSGLACLRLPMSDAIAMSSRYCASLIVALCLHGYAGYAEDTVHPPERRFMPPATPLVTCDPYFSIWSTGRNLTDVGTTHWTGKPHRLSSLLRVDGKSYRLMGPRPADIPPLPQKSLQVTPTQTVYCFADDSIEVELRFTTPFLPEDIDLLSRPITYVSYTVCALDGHEHDVSIYFSASAEIAVNERDQLVTASVESWEGIDALRMGSVDQLVLGHKGDDLRIDWGYLYVAASDQMGCHTALGSPHELREAFVNGEHEGDGAEPIPISDQQTGGVAASLTFDAKQVSSTPVFRWLVLAYDDLYSIEYMGSWLRPYWRRNGLDAQGLLTEAVRDYDLLRARCNKFDDELMADLEKVGGPEYAAIAALAYRQCFAAGKFVADANGQPIQFCKENHSNGCIGTSDVFYPMSPQFLLFGSSLAKSFVVPFMEYATSDRWKFPFAPHDLGTYPKANGQVYGGGERTEENQMPVEESGNLLILMAAIAKVDGNADFAQRYWPQLVKWADYLKQKGFDPDNQLCTDDFAGHMAHNVNLSAKAICGLGAFAQLCEMTGNQQLSREYRQIAEEFAARWINEANDGDHFRLAFDKAGTWSQKYNLVWDRFLGLNLFPDSVFRKEMDFYRRTQNRYGLPLDNRKTYTKLDWILWTATLTGNREDFVALVQPVYRFLQETPDRSPMTDWYETESGKKVGFTARPVVGGVFMQMLYDDAVLRKWSQRDVTKASGYAKMPRPPVLKVHLPAADTAAAEWHYTTDRPSDDWYLPEYDDSQWRIGRSGFGTRRTPGAQVGTEWRTPGIWLRRTFDLPVAASENLRLHVHYDEDAEIYINGVLAGRVRGHTTSYEQLPIRAEALRALKPTGNTLAVYCRNTRGGQYIDVGLATQEAVGN